MKSDLKWTFIKNSVMNSNYICKGRQHLLCLYVFCCNWLSSALHCRYIALHWDTHAMQLQCTAALTKRCTHTHTHRKLPINKHHHLLHTRVDDYRRGGVATEDSPSVANCVGSQMTLCGAIFHTTNIFNCFNQLDNHNKSLIRITTHLDTGEHSRSAFTFMCN